MFEFSVDFMQQWKKKLVTIGFDVGFGQHFQKVTTSLTNKRSAYCLKFVLLLAMVKQTVSHVPCNTV